MARRYHEVMRGLVDAVVGGEYAEGAWLPSEVDLQLRFGCSRGVMREALRGLEERGLIAVHSGRGQVVRQREHWDAHNLDVLRACVARGPDPTVLAQALDARAVIEREAALRAVVHSTLADLDLLAARVAEMERALEPAVGRSFDAADPLVVAESWFHRTLALYSDNPLLAKLSEPLHVLLAELRRARVPEQDRAVIRHHRRILEGLASREPDFAVETVEAYAGRLARWLRVTR